MENEIIELKSKNVKIQKDLDLIKSELNNPVRTETKFYSSAENPLSSKFSSQPNSNYIINAADLMSPDSPLRASLTEEISQPIKNILLETKKELTEIVRASQTQVNI